MDSAATRLLAAAVVLAAAACGGGGTATQAPTTTPLVPTAAAATATPEPSPPEPSPTPGPTRAAPILTGDAATNAACRLATVEEIEGQVLAGVRELKGLTSPGAYAPNSLTCAWYLDSEEIGIPSVLVQWEFPVTTHHDAVVDVYRMIVDQGLGTAVEGIGDMAMLQGWTAETIAGENILRVSVLQHVEPTTKDKEDAIALLRLFLERVEQQ